MESVIQLLGPPLVAPAEAAEALPRLREKSLAVLAYLATEARPVRRDTLAVLLWPESSPHHARGNLRTSLAELRRALGPDLIDATQELIAIPRAREITDLHRFRALAQQHEPESLWQAVHIYRGDFLQGFTVRGSAEFDTWMLRQAESLQHELTAILRRIASREEERGNADAAVPAARRLVAVDALEEEAHQLLIRLLLKQRRRQAALDQYEVCRRVLADELDAEPSAVTESLREAVLRGTPSPGDGSESVARPAATTPVAETDMLIGRDVDRAEILRLLMDPTHRLVTLEGPPGAGKTRLARAVMEQIPSTGGGRGPFGGGAVFIDLTRVHDDRSVPDAVATALGLRDTGVEGDRAEQMVTAFLEHRHVLLVLDNFEHVLPASRFVGQLLEEAPGTTVLTTSRERLGLAGERCYPVGPLAVPRTGGNAVQAVAESPAAQLFLRRARKIEPEFGVNADTAPAIAAVCTRLDGLPLAIELAVPLLRTFTVRELAANLDNRLQLLSRASGKLPQRHQSLRDAIAWSVDMLTEREASLFAGMGVFSTGADLAAILRVCGAAANETTILADLQSLVEKHLVRREIRRGRSRYRFLATVGEYAGEMLAASDRANELRRTHAEYFHEVALEARRELRGPRQTELLEELEDDHGNLQDALEWFLQQATDPEAAPGTDAEYGDAAAARSALDMCAALNWFWYRRGHIALGRRITDRALEAAPEEATPARARALHAAGWLAFIQGEWSRGRDRFQAAVEAAMASGETFTQTLASALLGIAERWLGNAARGKEYRDAALRLSARSGSGEDLAAESGDPWLRGTVLNLTYSTTGGRYDGEPPLRELQEAAELAVSTGDTWLIAHIHNGLGDVYRVMGRYAEARREYEESRAIFEEISDDWMTAWNHQGLGDTAAAEAEAAGDGGGYDTGRGSAHRVGADAPHRGTAAEAREEALRHFEAATALFERVGDATTAAEMRRRSATLRANSRATSATP